MSGSSPKIGNFYEEPQFVETNKKNPYAEPGLRVNYVKEAPKRTKKKFNALEVEKITQEIAGDNTLIEPPLSPVSSVYSKSSQDSNIPKASMSFTDFGFGKYVLNSSTSKKDEDSDEDTDEEEQFNSSASMPKLMEVNLIDEHVDVVEEEPFEEDEEYVKSDGHYSRQLLRNMIQEIETIVTDHQIRCSTCLLGFSDNEKTLVVCSQCCSLFHEQCHQGLLKSIEVNKKTLQTQDTTVNTTLKCQKCRADGSYLISTNVHTELGQVIKFPTTFQKYLQNLIKTSKKETGLGLIPELKPYSIDICQTFVETIKKTESTEDVQEILKFNMSLTDKLLGKISKINELKTEATKKAEESKQLLLDTKEKCKNKLREMKEMEKTILKKQRALNKQAKTFNSIKQNLMSNINDLENYAKPMDILQLETSQPVTKSIQEWEKRLA